MLQMDKVFSNGTEVFHRAFQLRGSVLQILKGSYEVEVGGGVPPQIWDSSQVALYDYAKVARIIEGQTDETL